MTQLPEISTYPEAGWSGKKILKELIESMGYSRERIVAKYTLFTPPAIVLQTENKAVFKIIRHNENEGQRGNHSSTRACFLDDNRTPTRLFLEANCLPLKLAKSNGNHFHHIHALSSDPEHYTALSNICMLPAFVHDLLHSDPRLAALIQLRAYKLYGYPGALDRSPQIPFQDPVLVEQYRQVSAFWCQNGTNRDIDLQATLGKWIHRAAKSHARQSWDKYGWLFNDFAQPASNAHPCDR